MSFSNDQPYWLLVIYWHPLRAQLVLGSSKHNFCSFVSFHPISSCLFSSSNWAHLIILYNYKGGLGKNTSYIKVKFLPTSPADPTLGYMPMGNSFLYPCNDFRRCLRCSSDFCNTKGNMTRRYCYKTTGDEGLYIRKNQLDFMEMCPKKETHCYTAISADGKVRRDCGKGDGQKNAVVCQTHLCNRQPAAIYCFVCPTADPNCVFSQSTEARVIHCRRPEFVGCYSRISGDGSVERGCAKTRTEDRLDSTYLFCDNRMLCNGKSTKWHSCYLYKVSS